MCGVLCGHIFNFFGLIPRSTVSGHTVRVCLLYKKPPNCLPKWPYHLAFPPAMMRVLIAPHPYLHLVSSLFWIWGILIGVGWYLIVVLIYISFMPYGVEYIFISLFATCRPPLVKCLLRSLAHFSIGLLVFLLSMVIFWISRVYFSSFFSIIKRCFFLPFFLSPIIYMFEDWTFKLHMLSL